MGDSGTHIYVCTRDVGVDQVTSIERGQTHGLVDLDFAVDTLDRRVKPQHPSGITLQDVNLVGDHEGLSDIRLVKRDVEHVSERWKVRKRT